jgi:hypothetical protein
VAVAYEEAFRKKFVEMRGDSESYMLDGFMGNPAMRAVIQCAFEAGREWQHNHNTADVTFPDYGAPVSVRLTA